jgi:short-subunit dehydrogenase
LRRCGSQARDQVLITGATDGLGLELAGRYWRSGAAVIGVGRRPVDQGQERLGQFGVYCQADLSRPGATDQVALHLEAQAIRALDRVILNAAVGSYGPVEANPDQLIDEQLCVNLLAPVRLIHRLLPLVLQAQGHIVIIGSVAAELPAPDYAVYAATKAAIAGLGRSLRVELAGRATVQVIHPGAMRTSFHAKVGVPASLRTARFADPVKVAERVHAVIESKRRTAVIGGGNRLLMWVGRHAPGVVEALVRRRRRA